MASDLIQPSFARGEISPSLYGRVDLAVYQIALRKATNMIVRPYGGIDNRPGLQYINSAKDSSTRSRVIPFEYSTEVTYVIELGHFYMRFYANGGRVEVASVPVELVTPWTEDEIFDVHFTQSADVMIFAHPLHKPQKLSRTSATSFLLEDFVSVDGPFRDLNSNEAIKVAASARVGAVTITANSSIFTAAMVGSLFYLENRNYSNIKPWAPGERDIALGSLRRSDGKTYALSATGTGLDWTETGGVRPVHDRGRAWDGGGEARTSSGQNYYVGVEWEFQDFGFGIVRITGYTSGTQVTGTVTKNLPAGVVGGVGSPGGTWTFPGTGSVGPYAIAGATSDSYLDYTVTINGVPVSSGQGDIGGGGEACVGVDMLLPGGIRAGDVSVGDELELFDPVTWTMGRGKVTFSQTKNANRWMILTASGATLICSDTAPIPTRNGYKTPEHLMGWDVPVQVDGHEKWSVVVDLVRLSTGPVQHITVGDRCFWAGFEAGSFICHHNAKAGP